MDGKFPQNFVFGISTAAYQVEGAWNEDGKGENIWDRFSHIPGNILHGDTGDVAVDSYHHIEDDVDLCAELGTKAYRFSVSWSRILPTGSGEVNETGIDYYDKLIDALVHRGIEPFLTIYHWDLPQMLQDEGGWANRATAIKFGNYCRLLFTRFGKKVHHWITLNEPWVAAFEGYYTGNFAPGIRDFSTALQVAHNLMLGHGLAVQFFREMQARGEIEGEIGLTLNLCPKEPLNDCKEDIAAAVRHDGYVNRWFLDPVFKGRYPDDMVRWYISRKVILPRVEKGDMELISSPIDFLGFNYYNIDYTRNAPSVWPIEFTTGYANGHPMTHSQYPVTPEGLYKILRRLNHDYAPGKIYITENGCSYQDLPNHHGKIVDDYRIDYIYRHLYYCLKAIQEGVPLAGYFYWSLFDNFEWATGYENRFGLVYVDHCTLERTAKKSFYWYKNIITNKRLVD